MLSDSIQIDQYKSECLYDQNVQMIRMFTWSECSSKCSYDQNIHKYVHLSRMFMELRLFRTWILGQ